MNRCINLLIFCTFLIAASISSANSDITAYFSGKLNKINTFLAKNHKKALTEPQLLVNFVDHELLRVWSAKNTIRAMLGPERWKKLSDKDTERLILAYENTIRRYLFEILQQYQGQKATVESLRLNSGRNKGWLRVILESSSLPDLAVDLKIYQGSGVWTVYDFSFQGISFVKMKRGFFRGTFDAQGVNGVISELNKKNQKFNQVLAATSDE